MDYTYQVGIGLYVLDFLFENGCVPQKLTPLNQYDSYIF